MHYYRKANVCSAAEWCFWLLHKGHPKPFKKSLFEVHRRRVYHVRDPDASEIFGATATTITTMRFSSCVCHVVLPQKYCILSIWWLGKSHMKSVVAAIQCWQISKCQCRCHERDRDREEDTQHPGLNDTIFGSDTKTGDPGKLRQKIQFAGYNISKPSLKT